MSSEREDCSSPDKATDASGKMPRQSRISYTREFLLSFSELEVCKKFPSGFDQSILSEFVGASPSIQDRPRTYGREPLQGVKRSEHSSSPPTRGDMGTYSRGNYGRWDNRPSGRNDRDPDSQSDKDLDSGRRFGSQSRRSWQGPEHDGLLGSGSFPRPSGYGGGVSAPKNHPNDQHQLNRSNGPYHPPRPYKAAPLSRGSTHGSYNDETFGSDELTSEDRAEEERKRRASFELMRKEQQKKATQEKQKVNLNNHMVDPVSEMSEVLNDGREVKNVSGNNELDTTDTESFSSTDLGKSVLPSQKSRPLVPPGFTNLAVEKDSGFKSLGRSDSAEVGKKEAEECLVQTSVQNGNNFSKPSSSSEIVGDQLSVDDQLFLAFLNKGDQDANPSVSLNGSRKASGIDHKHQASNISEAREVLDKSGMVELNSSLSGLSLDGEFNDNVLEKILGDALPVNASNPTDTIKIRDDKSDDKWTSKALNSSKFASWFVEEEPKATSGISSSSPNDLLSFLVGGNKDKPHDSDDKDVDHFNRGISPLGSEVSNKSVPSLSSEAIAASESVPRFIKQEAVQSVLTCEDLEQTILSEYSGPHLEGGIVASATSERPRTDDHASQHLLSLLQKGATQENAAPRVHADTIALEKGPASDVHGLGGVLRESVEEEGKNIQPPGKILTLETLFGTAFMQELQSVEAPVSIQRGSAGSPRETVGQQVLSSHVTENDVFSSATDHIGFEKTSNTNTFFTSDHRQKLQLDKTDKWTGFDDPLIDLNLSLEPAVVSKTVGFHGLTGFQLPEEESLISAVNQDIHPQFSRFLPGGNLNQFDPNAPGNTKIAKQLAAIGAFKDARPAVGVDGSTFLSGPFKQADRNNLYRDLHAQTSTSNFQSMHMNQGKPSPQQLDPHYAHMNSRGKFMGTESMIQHDVSANQQFPANMLRPSFHHPGMGVTGVDRNANHPMLQQLQMQMQMHGDYPPHLVNDFQRGNPVPQHAAGFIHDHNQMQGYPFGHGQPNIGGRGIPVPAPDVNGGRRHPEALQRFVDMELRANPKRTPPFSRWP